MVIAIGYINLTVFCTQDAQWMLEEYFSPYSIMVSKLQNRQRKRKILNMKRQSTTNGTDFCRRDQITLNRLSEKTGSPPASNLDPPVFKLSARMELLSLSAMYASVKSRNCHKSMVYMPPSNPEIVTNYLI